LATSTTFRNLLDIGAFMQTVGAAWLMISLKRPDVRGVHSDSIRTAVLRFGPSGRGDR
jgi:hypothetical protein